MKTLLALLFLGITTCFAAEEEVLTDLPKADDVLVVAVTPQKKEMKEYFTPDSLLKALPKLRRACVTVPVGDQVWWQSGVIVLKDNTVLFWRTCGDWFIAIDRPSGRSFYALPKKKKIPNKKDTRDAVPSPQI